MTGSSTPVVVLAARARVVLVAFAVACAYSAETWPPAGLVAAFFGAYFVQAWFAAYDGAFSRWRSWNWIGLVLAAFLLQMVGLTGYLLPWGQLWGWFVTVIMRDGGQPSEWLTSFFQFIATRTGRDLSAWIVLLLAWLFLLIDLLLARRDQSHDERRHRRWPNLPAILAAICLGWGVGYLLSKTARLNLNGLDLPSSILPEWYHLPAYAVLRSIPDKLSGVIVMLAAMLAPILVPWLVSPRCTSGSSRRWFQLACLLLGLAWVVLGWLGTQLPEGDVVWQSRILTIAYFAFFLLVLPFFAVWGRRCRKAEATAIAGAFD